MKVVSFSRQVFCVVFRGTFSFNEGYLVARKLSREKAPFLPVFCSEYTVSFTRGTRVVAWTSATVRLAQLQFRRKRMNGYQDTTLASLEENDRVRRTRLTPAVEEGAK